MHGLCGSSLVVVSVLVAAVASLHAPEDEWHEAIEAKDEWAELEVVHEARVQQCSLHGTQH